VKARAGALTLIQLSKRPEIYFASILMGMCRALKAVLALHVVRLNRLSMTRCAATSTTGMGRFLSS
jgi:hypothetical protein